MTEKLIYQVEAVLFAAGKFMDVEHIAQLMDVSVKDIKKVLKALKEKYEKLDSAIIIVNESNSWKMHVEREHVDLVSKIVADTELSKTVLETLAVVAWKSPILQSEVIHIRTSKAYEHIKELVESGFIIKEPEGRSYRLRITEKFFEYFDVMDKHGVSRLFKDVQHAYDVMMKNKRSEALEEGALEENGEPIPIVEGDKMGKLNVYTRKSDSEVVSVDSENRVPSELMGMAVVDLGHDVRNGDALAHLNDPEFMRYEEIKEKQEAEHAVVKENISEIDAELDGITSRNEKNEEDLRSFKRVDTSEESSEEQSDVADFLDKIDDQIDSISPDEKKEEE